MLLISQSETPPALLPPTPQSLERIIALAHQAAPYEAPHLTEAEMKEFKYLAAPLGYDETKANYAKWWEWTDGGKNYRVPGLANALLAALEQLPDKPGRAFILDDSYADQPFAKNLQNDALQ